MLGGIEQRVLDRHRRATRRFLGHRDVLLGLDSPGIGIDQRQHRGSPAPRTPASTAARYSSLSGRSQIGSGRYFGRGRDSVRRDDAIGDKLVKLARSEADTVCIDGGRAAHILAPNRGP
jgi:hypothetical protein